MSTNPFDELENLLEQLEEGFDFPSLETLSVDMLDQGDKYVVRADLPGYDPSDIDITYSDGQLTITGERDEESIEEVDGTYLRRERRRQSASRTVTVPGEIDEDGIEANHSRGVLSVTLPRTEAEEERQIEIE